MMPEKTAKKRALVPAPVELPVAYPAAPGTIVSTTKQDPYAGAGERAVSREQGVALCGPVEEEAVRILPDTGSVYLPWEWYAHRLTIAFGPMGWSLLPVLDAQGQPVRPEIVNDVIYREYILRADGRFVASAIGECGYRPTNRRMTWGDAVEGARSNALSRCCKSLGMAHEIYDEVWREEWKRKHAVCVNALSGGRLVPLWRRRDQAQLAGEQGHANPPCPCEKCAKGERTMAADGKFMPPPPAPAAPDTTNPCITANQARNLYAQAKKYGWSEAAIKETLIRRYRVTSSLKLSLDAYQDALDHFASTKPEVK